jgi:hypothetical protein
LDFGKYEKREGEFFLLNPMREIKIEFTANSFVFLTKCAR